MQFYLSLLATSLKSMISLRATFFLEVILLFLNNCVFLVLWWLFFLEFRTVGSWQIQEVVLTLAFMSASYGLMTIFFGGVRMLSRTILSGGLDPFLTQPKNILLHLLMSTSLPRGFGHLFTAAFFLICYGLTDFQTIILFCLGAISGCIVLTSVRTIANSLSFWGGSIEPLAERYVDSLFLLGSYPTNIYSGWLQFLMFTLVPAGIMTYLPVELIREFYWSKLLLLLFAAAFFAFLAFFVFYRGLRRYESGNQIALRV